MPSYDAVLFDMDGTLCERTQDADAIYAAAFERAGVDPFGSADRLWAALDGPPDHDDRAGYLGVGFARLAAQEGRRGVDVLALGRALAAAVDDSQVAWLPGAKRALEAAGATAQVGLVTNGPRRRQQTKLDALAGQDSFDAAVYAADLERRKPHAEPFERALAALDAAPSATLHVGDSLAYDVAGAHAAGLDAAWLGEDPDPYQPEYVLADLGDLPEVLGA